MKLMRIRTGTSAQADGTCCRTDSCKSAVHFMRLPGHAAEYTNCSYNNTSYSGYALSIPQTGITIINNNIFIQKNPYIFLIKCLKQKIFYFLSVYDRIMTIFFPISVLIYPERDHIK